jgi:hypothetical protein
MRGKTLSPVRSSVNKAALNLLAPLDDSRLELSTPRRVSTRDQEFFMQAIVDKVMRAFAFKHPVSDAEAKLVRQEVTDFAAELLENYKSQLAHRTLRAGRG